MSGTGLKRRWCSVCGKGGVETGDCCGHARLREERDRELLRIKAWRETNDENASLRRELARLREERDELGLINTGILTVLAASDLWPTIPQERYPMVAQIKALRVSLAEALEALRRIDKLHSCILSRAPEHRPEPLCAGCAARRVLAAHPEGTKGAGK